MKGHSAASFILLAAMPAQAQVVTSRGTKLGYDCYRQALVGADAQKGLETCTLALERERLSISDRAATLDNRGVILDRLDRTEEADADFRNAIALAPGLGDAYVNRGAVLIKRKAFGEALAEIDRGIALGTSFPHIAEYNRAISLQMLGRNREAYEGYRRVLTLEPGFTQAAEQLKNFTIIRRPAAPAMN